MSRNYSPRTFLRETPNRLLQQYFASYKVLSDFEWEDTAETDIEAIDAALQACPSSLLNRIESDFRRVNELACEKGIQILLDEARDFSELNLVESIEGLENHYARAFWTFQNHSKIFQAASCYHSLDLHRPSILRQIGPLLVPAQEDADLKCLGEGIRDFYRRQGRGYRCHVDHSLRKDPVRHCYFVYPEDYATTELGFDDIGRFLNRPTKPVFEVVFVYRPDTGMLELYAKGARKDKERLMALFCERILSLPGLPDEQVHPFALNTLKDHSLELVTEPQDGIAKVLIRMLRLDLPGVCGRRISLEDNAHQSDRGIYRMLENALNPKTLTLEDCNVTKARLKFQFMPVNGQKGKTRAHFITSRNGRFQY